MLDDLKYIQDLFRDGTTMVENMIKEYESTGRYRKIQSKRLRDLILKIKKEAPALRGTLVDMDKKF